MFWLKIQQSRIHLAYFAQIRSGSVTLKENHKHLFQIQGKIAPTKIPCVVYTHYIFTIQRIRFNEDFWNNMYLKLTDFYILPKACTLCQEVNVNS